LRPSAGSAKQSRACGTRLPRALRALAMTLPHCFCERSEAIPSVWRAIATGASRPRNDNFHCYCERSEAISWVRPTPMSEEHTIRARRLKDGTLVEVLPDGSTRPFPPDQTDWPALRAMTEEEINAAALADPDNPPITPERQARLKRVPQVKSMRRALRLTQEEFSARVKIPLGTLRDWGARQGRARPGRARLSHRHCPRPRGGAQSTDSAPGPESLNRAKSTFRRN
jgi:putative transcriptional regulator